MNLETGGQIATYANLALGTFIVEYYQVPQFSPATAIETFEVIFYDPNLYPTSTGDGQILVQYNLVTDPSSCSIGIENGAETVGLQYLYDGTYDPHSAPLQAESAILYTTPTQMPSVTLTLTPYGLPIQIPVGGGSFDYNIAATNNGVSSINFDCWCDVTLPSGSIFGPTLGPVNLTLPGLVTMDRDRTQTVPGAAPGGNYVYHGYAGNYPGTVWSEDNFDFAKLEGGFGPLMSGWLNDGEDFDQVSQAAEKLPEEFAVVSVSPNPFNPKTAIRYQLSAGRFVSLRIYDTAGRLISTLVDGWREAGTHEAIFDGSSLASGVYLIRLTAGEFQHSGKMLLLK
jgi:hypothetical protein